MDYHVTYKSPIQEAFANRELEGSKNGDRERQSTKLDYTISPLYLVAEKKIFNLG